MPTRYEGRQAARLASLLATVALGVAVVILTLGSEGTYAIHARFVDAGQLVKGNVVQVSGRRIGTVTALRLTDDNQADVALEISEDEFRPLHRGTVASIRTIGLAGVANRYVDISPGPRSAPEIPDGGVLSTAQTRPIVDLDELLNALDSSTRARLQRILRNGAKVFAGATDQANLTFAYLNPALSQTNALAEEVLRDQAVLEYLLQASATTFATLASRRADLEAGLRNTRVALRAVAGERSALGDSLARAPRVLVRSRGTLRRLRHTLTTARPALREAQPVAPPLARVLREIVPTARNLRPVVADVRSLLPGLQRALEGLPALARAAIPALRPTIDTLRKALPIVRALRIYSPDLVAGLLNGFGGTTAGGYDANGHFARISPHGGPGGFTGLLAALFGGAPPDPASLNGYRTGLTARCPGGAVEPAKDGSNPWIPDRSLCDPDDDHRP